MSEVGAGESWGGRSGESRVGWRGEDHESARVPIGIPGAGPEDVALAAESRIAGHDLSNNHHIRREGTRRIHQPQHGPRRE